MYKAAKDFRIGIAAGSYQTYKEGGDFVLPKNNDEFRLWPQAILTQNIGPIKVEQRYRFEMRFTQNGYRNRFRYRLGLNYAFGKPADNVKPFFAGLSNELFFTNNEPYFERNRLLFSFGYKPNKTSTIHVGYLHQFDYKITDETGMDFFQIGYLFELNSR
jgi:long-subunit fatty acid transport protein